jgi:virginiamycin B lyase
LQNRTRRLLLVIVVLAGAAAGIAERALAQTITEFPVPGTTPTGITVGSDGALWFTETAAGQIGRITIAGVITEFPIPTPSSNPLGCRPGSWPAWEWEIR